MTAALRNFIVYSAVFTGLLSPAFGQTPAPATPAATAPKPDANAPLTTDQLSAEYQKLSPESKAALLKQLGSIGSGSMTEEQMKSSFNSLPPDLKSQLQAKWDGLSDEQRIALKKMKPDAVKQIVGSLAQQKMQQMLAPIQGAIDKGKEVVDKGVAFAQKARSYVQNFLGKLFGSGSSKSTE